MTHRDLYADARRIGERLRQRGHVALADRITDDIDAGSTSSEILFALRSTLNHALDVLSPDDDERLALAELRDAIDSTLTALPRKRAPSERPSAEGWRAGVGREELRSQAIASRQPGELDEGDHPREVRLPRRPGGP